MEHCDLCERSSHCPTPALRAQEDNDFKDCAFFRRLTRAKYSEKLSREWAQAEEAASYIHAREATDRYEQRLRDKGRPGYGGSAHKGVVISQPHKAVDMEDYLE
jgi:hypothetical protein